jgi:hypothetical protein
MPPENQPPIEELLQQSAQQRRAAFGGSAKMPNPMRARLHEEITRASRAAAEPEPRQSWLAAYWPRLVIGAAAAAVVVIGASMMLWQPTKNGAANYAIRERQAIAPAPPSAPVPDPRPLVEARETEAARHPNENPQLFADAAAEPPPAAAPLQEPQEAAAAGAARPLDIASRATGVEFQQTPGGVASRGAVQPPAAANVLNTFRIQQEGSTIRVIDEDGSVYTGELQLIADSPRAGAAMARRKSAASTAPAAAPAPHFEAAAPSKDDATASGAQEFTFRATGYNASLQKQVVFEGNYIAPAAAPEELSQRGGARAEADEPRARVVGRARAGDAEVPVDAVAAPQPQRARSNQ